MYLQNFFKFVKKTSVKIRKRKPSALPVSEIPCRQFSLAELKAATNNFDVDSKIADDGFDRMYKGLIDGGSLVVAVKRFHQHPSSAQRTTELFQNEVELLCQLRHQNLISLIGFCKEKDERIVVYEHMTYGSLDRHLFRNADPLPWKRRLEICIGAASGLHYLHTGAKSAIIHRDLKPSNILLDENWDAKLSDFGLSKIDPSSMPKPNPMKKKTEGVAGTLGYIAPELIDGELSVKADVYSLGIVMLEVLCGRRLVDAMVDKSEEISLPAWIIKCIRNGCVHITIDPFLKGKIAPVCLIEFLEIALSCIYQNPNRRPSIGEVEVTLELALELQEKADLVIEAINPHVGYTYEDVSFRVSFTDRDVLWLPRIG